MEINIDLNTAEFQMFTPQVEPEKGKKWSYFNVYYLEDLRNIYWLYDKYDVTSIPCLYKLCTQLGLKSASGKAWSQRNLLELVNALKNFHLISLTDNKVDKPGLFHVVKFEEKINSYEKSIFEDLYFSYFRFKEFHRLFVNDTNIVKCECIGRKSQAIISFSGSGKYTDHFVINTSPKTIVVSIPEQDSDVTRFWDVYVKWGVTLGLLKKYPLKPFGITLIPAVNGSSIVYFCCKMPADFSVFRFAIEEMEGSYLYIPDIIYSVILARKFTIEDIKQKIIDECLSDYNTFRPQSTSAIFVNEKEDFLLPKIGNTYITHLLKL